MAIVIVHLLQPVHVNEKDRQLLSGLFSLIKHPAGQSLVSQTIIESGHRILCGNIRKDPVISAQNVFGVKILNDNIQNPDSS